MQAWKPPAPCLHTSASSGLDCSFLPSFLGRSLEPCTIILAELGEKAQVGIPTLGAGELKVGDLE